MIVPEGDGTLARPREFDEDQVLDAVMETFWRHGYEGTSAQNLVDATGLGRGSLYAAYTNKDGLFEQALLRYRKRAEGHADQLRQKGSPKERLRALMTDIVDADLKAAERRGCLATNSAIEMAGRDPRVAELVRQNFAILTRGIEETIRRGQVTGEMRPEADASALALFVLNAVQGLRVLAKTTRQQDRKKLIAIIDHTLAAIA
ncbi:TetR/AcrR family transcriptional regulator [Rhizobium puerariae]|uniref:TetR/AcrR family transcriptional regulator n=1 Tax=Rhizobium puerariae TaxID=1585791 RepID=A0ABV6AAB5_9HYPH